MKTGSDILLILSVYSVHLYFTNGNLPKRKDVNDVEAATFHALTFWAAGIWCENREFWGHSVLFGHKRWRTIDAREWYFSAQFEQIRKI